MSKLKNAAAPESSNLAAASETKSELGSERDWSKTLFLPKTDFPMKAGLPRLEPQLLERWEKMKLYDKLRKAAKGRERFTLHDGPPYANGNTFLFLIRFQSRFRAGPKTPPAVTPSLA